MSQGNSSPDNSEPPVAGPGAARRDPYIALRNPNYRRFYIGNACSLIGMQMTTFTVAYEIYERTSSVLILGCVGLVQVIPVIAMALPAGHFLDRINRKHAILWSTGIQAILFLLLGFSSGFASHYGLPAYASRLHDLHVPILFFLLLINGACRSLNQPAKQSLMPLLVPPQHFSNAVTWNVSLFEASNIVGPMIGGFLLAGLMGKNALAERIGQDHLNTWAYAIVYWINGVLQFMNWINVSRIDVEYKPHKSDSGALESMLAGIKFVHSNKVILAAITLDLFAVLLGGATMMLPVFAKKVIHPVSLLPLVNDPHLPALGPVGISWLRAAASIGSISMAFILTHRPPMKRAGRNYIVAVVGFGIATIVFGLSRNFYLSLIALFFTGFFDNISVVVRHSLVQLGTPDQMRGRVSSVNSMFISISNELGEFESGATTWLMVLLLAQTSWAGMKDTYGPMLAVAAGGAGTIITVALAVWLWPQLAAVKKLDGKH